MLILTNPGTADKIQLVTSAAITVDVYGAYVDHTTSTDNVVAGRQYTAITTATTTDIVAGPASGDIRNVKTIHIRNKHASTAVDVTVLIDVAGTDYELFKVTLAAGYTLEFVEGVGFFVPTVPASNPVAYNTSVAAQGPGFATDTYVTGSNLLVGGRLKVGSILRWNIHMTKTAASTAVTAAIIRFGTAGAIGDTARVTMAGPAQTAAVDEALLEIEAVVRTAGASGILQGQMAIQHSAAVAAGFGEMFDTITSAAFDLTVSASQAGISLNGSTAAAWTINTVTSEAFNLSV